MLDIGHTERMAKSTQPTGDTDPVFACPDCASLVVDQAVHGPVCPARAGGTPGELPPLGPQILAWLDELNPEELEQQAFAEAGFDVNTTVAILDRLKKLAAEL